MDHNHLPPPIPQIALSPADSSEATTTGLAPVRHSGAAPLPSRQTTTQTFLSSYTSQPGDASEGVSPPSPALSTEPLFPNKTSTSLRDNLDVS